MLDHRSQGMHPGEWRWVLASHLEPLGLSPPYKWCVSGRHASSVLASSSSEDRAVVTPPQGSHGPGNALELCTSYRATERWVLNTEPYCPPQGQGCSGSGVGTSQLRPCLGATSEPLGPGGDWALCSERWTSPRTRISSLSFKVIHSQVNKEGLHSSVPF